MLQDGKFEITYDVTYNKFDNSHNYYLCRTDTVQSLASSPLV